MNNKLVDQKAEKFIFPEFKDMVDRCPNLKSLKEVYDHLYNKRFKDVAQAGWYLYFRITKINQPQLIKHHHFENLIQIFCSICTSKIEYGIKKNSRQCVLIKMQNYHVHFQKIEDYCNFLSTKSKYLNFFKNFLGYRTIKDNNINYKHKTEQIFNIIMSLPRSLTDHTKNWIMKKTYGLSTEEFRQLRRKFDLKFESSFGELILQFKKNGFKYSYLPTNLLSPEQVLFSCDLNPEELPDETNPGLPNILVIVTPEMMVQYEKFGQWMGFDLTFSVIRERTKDNGQYMIGVIACTNSSKKIIIFALIITNSQTVFAYQYIFTQFFEIVRKQPDVIITDEEKAIYLALRNLKKQGIFKGTHLFDMFHVLRKFRKCSSERHQFRRLFRDLIHADNRFEYRRIFRLMMSDVQNEKELNILRNFDLMSQFYCYGQIDPKFVGIGVSNNVNQFFHSVIKNDIPYAAKYMKSVQMVLKIISRRFSYAKSHKFLKYNIEQVFNCQFMNPFKILICDKVFLYILKETNKSLHYRVLTEAEEKSKNLNNWILDQSESALEKNHYYVQNREGDIYLVYKQFKKQDQMLKKQRIFKWNCLCGLNQKTGYACAHILKVIFKNGTYEEDLNKILHNRWKINLNEVEETLLNSKFDHVKLKKKRQEELFFKIEEKTKTHNIFTGRKEDKCTTQTQIEKQSLSGSEDGDLLQQHQQNEELAIQIKEEPVEMEPKNEKIISSYQRAKSEKMRMLNKWIPIYSNDYDAKTQFWIYPTKNSEECDLTEMKNIRVLGRRRNF